MLQIEQMEWRSEKNPCARRILAENKHNFMLNLKTQIGCIYCSVDNPIILLLHHVEPQVQTRGTRQQPGFNWLYNSWSAIMKELKKCVVVCLNHHGLEHNKIKNYTEHL